MFFITKIIVHQPILSHVQNIYGITIQLVTNMNFNGFPNLVKCDNDFGR